MQVKVEEENQAEIKNKIKAWLKLNGKSYKDIADECSVTEATVRNWMAKKKIPIAKAKLLEQVISHSNVSESIADNVSTKNDNTVIVQALKVLHSLKATYDIDYKQSVFALIGELSFMLHD